MSSKYDRPEPPGANPFWILVTVLLLLGADYGVRFAALLKQRDQLDQARLMQAQNIPQLAQAREFEGKLEPLSLELLQIARTNDSAKQIVREFNIQWNPTPTVPSGLGTPTTPSAPPAPTTASAPGVTSALPTAPVSLQPTQSLAKPSP